MNSLDDLAIFKNALAETKRALLDAENTVLRNAGNIKTAADYLAQETLVNFFKEHTLSCTLYSEESPEPIMIGSGTYTISVDPVDNSYLFVKGIKAFSSIAMTVMQDNQVVYAFVQSLGADELYYCDAKSAFLNDKELQVEVHEPVIIAGYAARPEYFETITRLTSLPSNYYYLNTGGPLLSAMVASNNLSAAVEFRPTGFYELAGSFIAQKAGAFVETITGEPFVLDPLRKQAIITANSEELLRELQTLLT